MTEYHVMLTTRGEARSEFLTIEREDWEEPPGAGEIFFVDGRWVAVERIEQTVSGHLLLESRRVYRFALLDEDGEDVEFEAGEFFHDDAEIPVGHAFMTDDGSRFRVLDADASYGRDRRYDGALIVEPFPG